MSRLLQVQLDASLLRLAAAGDGAAQREVYEALAAPVFALVRRVVGGRAAAEDVFQDSMLAVLRHLEDFRGEAPFGAWVRQVALRHCLMHLRSPWQRLRTVLADIDLPAPPAGDADRIDLERALARLPEVARVIVWLHDVEGLTHEEIAALYGRTPSFSKSQLSRAHALLRELLEPPSAEPVAPATAITAQGQVP